MSDDQDALASAYQKQKSSILAQGELQKAAAQRRLQQQGNSIGSGAMAKLNEENNQSIDLGVDQQTSALGLQEAQQKSQQAFQQQGVDLSKAQFEEQKSEYAKDFEQNLKTTLFNKMTALKDIDLERFKDIAATLGMSLPEARVATGTNTNQNTPGYYGTKDLAGLGGQAI